MIWLLRFTTLLYSIRCMGPGALVFKGGYDACFQFSISDHSRPSFIRVYHKKISNAKQPFLLSPIIVILLNLGICSISMSLYEPK